MNRFHQEFINETSEISALLIERLTNELPLSLYVDGMFSHIGSNGKTTDIGHTFGLLFKQPAFFGLMIFNVLIYFRTGSTFKFARGQYKIHNSLNSR